MYCPENWIHENFKSSLPWNQPTNISTLDLIGTRDELGKYIDQLEVDMDHAWATNSPNKGEITANYKASKLYWAFGVICEIKNNHN